MEIILKSKDVIEFESFIPKQSNLIKVRLHTNDKDPEGIWACVSDTDIEDYKNGVVDKGDYPIRVATLRNAALAFHPANSWGLCIPVKFKGSERPECNLDWVDSSSTVSIIETETQE